MQKQQNSLASQSRNFLYVVQILIEAFYDKICKGRMIFAEVYRVRKEWGP